MAIDYRKGDIFGADVEALVNSVNCVGVMGRGIALQFKQRFPENFRAYRDACEHGIVQPGSMFITETSNDQWPRYLINFPTKRHWRGKSKIQDIESGLRSLAREIRWRGIGSIALPALASDLGGLPWTAVKERIDFLLGPVSTAEIIVYEPGSTPFDGRSNPSTEPPQLTGGRVALISLVAQYLRASLDEATTLLEIHKLMYLLQEAGEPLRLDVVKERYGPYAVNLRHVLKAMNSHYITGYGGGGDDPTKLIRLLPGAVQDARAFLRSAYQTYGRIENVTRLIDGFESPAGLELLATVHWVATREGADTPEKAIRATYAWNERKRQFSERHIRFAFDRLQEQGWLPPSAGTSA